MDRNLEWFGYIARLSQWGGGGRGHFTRSNDFYLPSLRLEGGGVVSTLCGCSLSLLTYCVWQCNCQVSSLKIILLVKIYDCNIWFHFLKLTHCKYTMVYLPFSHLKTCFLLSLTWYKIVIFSLIWMLSCPQWILCIDIEINCCQYTSHICEHLS